MSINGRTDTKRNHIVPMEYLWWFRIPTPKVKGNEVIYMYDKEDRKWIETPIQNAAVRKKYYYQDDETGLADEVEYPAQKPLRKLREGETIDFTERLKISWYIYSMIARVPVARTFADRIIKDNSGCWAEEMLNEWRLVHEVAGIPVSEQDQQYMDEMVERLKRDPTDWPNGLYEEMMTRVQYKSNANEMPDTVHILPNFAWRVISAPKGNRFITSDNPVHVFSIPNGPNNPDFELVMPLSSKCALHISRQGLPQQLEFVSGDRNIVRRLNIRILSVVDRFVFSSRKERWIENTIRRPKHMYRIPHISWGNVPYIKGFYRGPVCDKCGTVFTHDQIDGAETTLRGEKDDGDIILKTIKTIWHECRS